MAVTTKPISHSGDDEDCKDLGNKELPLMNKPIASRRTHRDMRLGSIHVKGMAANAWRNSRPRSPFMRQGILAEFGKRSRHVPGMASAREVEMNRSQNMIYLAKMLGALGHDWFRPRSRPLDTCCRMCTPTLPPSPPREKKPSRDNVRNAGNKHRAKPGEAWNRSLTFKTLNTRHMPLVARNRGTLGHTSALLCAQHGAAAKRETGNKVPTRGQAVQTASGREKPSSARMRCAHAGPSTECLSKPELPHECPALMP